jgi:hypothetical protein
MDVALRSDHESALLPPSDVEMADDSVVNKGTLLGSSRRTST